MKEPDKSSQSRPLFVVKYGGNAMTDPDLQKSVLQRLIELTKREIDLVLVHGGGPFIQEVLNMAQIESSFVAGQRKTTAEAMPWIEMALKGKVNGSLVRQINALGGKAVGLSGKDGGFVIARKHLVRQVGEDGAIEFIDIGRVGEVENIDSSFLYLLLNAGYLPVIACVAADKDGKDYNINADLFAAGLAAALSAAEFILLTDIDGLLNDRNDPTTLISTLYTHDIDKLVEAKIVQGGMIPKLSACQMALEGGCQSARIMNGTKPELLLDITGDSSPGTKILIHESERKPIPH